MTTHPPFLLGLDTTASSAPFDTFFKHSHGLAKGTAQVLYIAAAEDVKSVLVFITGNPSLLPLYTAFFTALAQSSPNLAIIGHGHLGHAKHLPAAQFSAQELNAQVDANVELLDAVTSWAGPEATIILAGHSVGAWITCEVTKRRPDVVDSLFLLTPTLSNIASTPNGKRLRLLFTPLAGWLLPKLSPLLIPFTPLILPWFLPKIEKTPRLLSYNIIYKTLRDFLTSPNVLTSVLALVRSEMRQILGLDEDFLRESRDSVHILWAGKDDWVGDERLGVERALAVDRESGNERVLEGGEGIVHAFCLEHSEQVAEICSRWLKEGGLTEGKAMRRLRLSQRGPEVVQSEGSSSERLGEVIM